jgi:hypothetical protein
MRRVIRWTVAISFASAVALGGSVASQASTPACNSSQGQRIEHGAPGPIVCSSKGIKTIWVARRTTLALTSMHVNVVATRLTKKLAITSFGTTISHATAQGEFVVVTLRISNNTNKPQSFDDLAQTELQVGNDQFSVSTNGDESDKGSEGWNGDIEPGESATGDIVFDVSARSAADVPRHAGLLIVNFGDDVSFGSVSEVGIVYLGS